MSSSFRFTSIRNNPQAGHVHLFVHGYLSASDERDRNRLLRCVPRLPDNEDAVFAFWDSGSLREVWLNVLQGAASGFGLGKIGLARGAAVAALGGYRHYSQKKNHARTVALALLPELHEYLGQHHPQLHSISLYGHSLGARLLIEALLAGPVAGGPPVRDLVFMGGARSLGNRELELLLPQVERRICNFYSRSDRVLMVRPSTGKYIGRHPLVVPDGQDPERIFNLDLDVGHSDYWHVLYSILQQVRSPA